MEFSKNPMPFQKPLNLPYCGLNSSALPKRELGARFKFPKNIGEAAGQLGEGLKEVGKFIESGLAPIGRPKPTLIDRP